MPAKWAIKEERRKKKELKSLYIEQNKTIFETGEVLGIKFQTVYDRLLRLKIKPCPKRKLRYLNKHYAIEIPRIYSERLAELTGILLGDGHIANTQIVIYINSSETPYIKHIERLLKKTFW